MDSTAAFALGATAVAAVYLARHGGPQPRLAPWDIPAIQRQQAGLAMVDNGLDQLNAQKKR